MNRRKTGTEKEQSACRYLENHGCRILEQNYHAGRYGEIDIVAEEDGFLVFAEVKYRSGNAWGDPLEAVDFRKQQRICRVADRYLAEHRRPQDTPCRFDVIGITAEEIRWVPNAFPYIPARSSR